MERARYEPVEFSSEADAEAAITRNDPEELLYVPIAVSLHAERFEWAQALCIRLATHPHFNVRGNAVLGFGHLARRFRRIDRAAVEPLVLRALTDSNEYVRGQAAEAVHDLRHFLGWDLAPEV
jgi:hypothetical protein